MVADDLLVDRAEHRIAGAVQHLDLDPVAETHERGLRRAAIDGLDHPSFRQAGRAGGAVVVGDRAGPQDGAGGQLAALGGVGNIRPMPNRVRHPVFSPWVYRQRNAVERFFNKLKHFRAVATRYDKRDDNDLASVQLASMRIGLSSYESAT